MPIYIAHMLIIYTSADGFVPVCGESALRERKLEEATIFTTTRCCSHF